MSKRNRWWKLILSFGLAAACGAAWAESPAIARDNSKVNVRDESRAQLKTADDQSLTGVERIAAIRREIVANDKLSTYGKNVKIIDQGETVLLRGPVKSSEEKDWIGAAAKRAAPKCQIVNELEVSN